MADARSELPVPTEPWVAAKQRFLAGLSSEDIQRFKDARLENIFYDSSATQKRHANGSKSWLLQERLSSFVEGIEDYGKAMDVYTNACSLILSPLWGSVRVILHILNESGKFQEKLVDMLAQIGDILPRFRIYQILFSKHERLLQALSSAYLDVLCFCVRTKDMLLPARKSYIPLSIILKGIWKPLRKDFDDGLIKFRKHQKVVEKEVKAAHMIESAHARELQRIHQVLQVRDRKFAKRHRILSTLPTVDYTSKHVKSSNLRHPGTNQWILKHPGFVTWHTSNFSDCLICYGIPGAGKSVLAASIIDELRAEPLVSESLLLYYYCDYSDISSLEMAVLIGSLIKQILVMVPIDAFDTSSSPFVENPSRDIHEMIQYVSHLLSGFQIVTIVVDGLDELVSHSQRATLDFLKSLLKLSPTIVKLFLTSRVEEYETKNCFKDSNQILLNQEWTTDDIALFIDARVNEIAKHNSAMAESKVQRDVKAALTTGARSMYLWVSFQLDDLQEASTELAIRRTIENFPKSLSDTYARVLQKILDQNGHKKLRLVGSILGWINCARRPLLIEELEEAVGLEQTDFYLHYDRIATNAGPGLVSACKNLVTYDVNTRVVSFAHYTVSQYLASIMTSPDSVHDQPPIDFMITEQEIGQICITYLCFSDFETQLVSVPTELQYDRRKLESIVWAGIPLGSVMRKVVGPARWLNTTGSKTANNRISLSSAIATKELSEMLAKKYIMLDYIVTFWLYHTADFDPTTSCWSNFNSLIWDRHLMFEFRPWNTQWQRDRIVNTLKHRMSTASSRISRNLIKSWENSVEFSMYTWAIEHSTRSILHMLYKIGWLEKHDKFFPLGLRCGVYPMLEPDKGTLWSANALCRLLDISISHHQNHKLYFYKQEFFYWVSSDPLIWDSLMEQTMLLCITQNKQEAFDQVSKFHVLDLPRLAQILDLAIDNGHDQFWFINSLLRYKVTNTRDSVSIIKLASALSKCLDTVDLVCFVLHISKSEMNKTLLLVLLQLAMSCDDRMGLTKTLLYKVSPIVLPGLAPEYQAPRALSTFNDEWLRINQCLCCGFKQMTSMKDLTILGMGFVNARKYADTIPPERAQADSKLTMHCSLLCSLIEMAFAPEVDPISSYENQNIKLLCWAIEFRLDWLPLERLKAAYQQYGTEEQKTAALLQAANTGLKYVEWLADMHWSYNDLHEVIKLLPVGHDPEILNLLSYWRDARV